MIRTLFLWLTGGRPMRLIAPCVFIDKVTGESVNMYADYKGHVWLATSAWAPFRREKYGDSK